MKLSANQKELLEQISVGALPRAFKKSDLHYLMAIGMVRRKVFSSEYVVTSRGAKRYKVPKVGAMGKTGTNR